jgi:hypothetical protein
MPQVINQDFDSWIRLVAQVAADLKPDRNEMFRNAWFIKGSMAGYDAKRRWRNLSDLLPELLSHPQRTGTDN